MEPKYSQNDKYKEQIHYLNGYYSVVELVLILINILLYPSNT